MGYVLTITLALTILPNEPLCLGIYSFERQKKCFLVPLTRNKFNLKVGGRKLTVEGCVTQSMGGTTFQAEIQGNKKILCELSGKLRVNRIRIDIGNKVIIELHHRYPTRGRIIRRLTNQFYKPKTFGMPRQLQKKNHSDLSDHSES